MTNKKNDLDFLKAKVGNAFLTHLNEVVKIISMVGGARNQHPPTLFQLINVDTGEIKFCPCE